MFCTGGIRCEKATALPQARRASTRSIHLKGGILKYLETVPAADSLWQGECFVFDQRVAVGHGLAPGTHALCHACRMPVSAGGSRVAAYVEGVSCPACHAEAQRRTARGLCRTPPPDELAAARGEAHVGAVYPNA